MRPQTPPAWQVPPKQAPDRKPAERPPAILVDPAVCRYLRTHAPAPDVEYRPGVDVDGRPVAPADLPGGADLALPDPIEIGITVPLAGRFGIPADALFAGEAYIGTVTLDGNRVLFNGRPVQSAAEQDLVAVCARQSRHRR